MTRKVSFGIVVVLIVISIVISSTATVFIIFTHYNKLISDLPEKAEQYIRLSEIDELLRNEYYGNINIDFIDARLAEGYIDGLDDEYSIYISADEFDDFSNYLDGKMSGSGITAFCDESTGYLKVSHVASGSSAALAGIDSDCSIVAVNGNAVNYNNYEQLYSLISGGYDKTVVVSYIKGSVSEAQPIEIELTLGYEINSCFYNENTDIGYIRITDFTQKTISIITEALKYYSANAVSDIIIDVRNCSSYNYDVAAKIIDAIVPICNEGTGAIYTAKDINGEIIQSYSSDSVSVNLSFAVLINSRTAGAAELLAVDLSDFGKAILVGENTAGNGKLQKLFRLSDGGAVFLTVAKVYPYISDSFDEIGVAPHIVSESTDAFDNRLDFTDFENDHQYQAAFSYLSDK